MPLPNFPLYLAPWLVDYLVDVGRAPFAMREHLRNRSLLDLVAPPGPPSVTIYTKPSGLTATQEHAIAQRKRKPRR